MLRNNSGKSLMRSTWVEIDLTNIAYNVQQARKFLNPKTKIAGVLKANAYGHGAIHTAKTLIENNVDMLAVACITEAIELRRHYSEIPIMIMGYTPDEELKVAVENHIAITIFSLEQAKKLSDIGLSLNKDAIIHIKIDTGMNRIGFKIDSHTVDTIVEIYKLKNIKIEGIFTHLALKNSETDKHQFDLFMSVINELESREIYIPIKHICDGIGMELYPEYHLDMVRLGSFIYGGQSLSKDREPLRLAMTFKTKIAQVKEIQKGEGVGYGYSFVAQDKCLVGTLPVGYADGYFRCLAGIGEVGIKGKRALVIGKICMDQMMIDLSNIPDAKVGDEVVLLGENSIDSIPLSEVAKKADANRNDVLSSIRRRVPRVYIENSNIIDIVDYLLD